MSRYPGFISNVPLFKCSFVYRYPLGYYELKKHKLWFDERCSKLLDQRKLAKLQWLQDPSEIDGDNLNYIRRETSRYFRTKKREYLKDEIDERLYGCETWSLTLREEHRLRVLRRIFGPKRDEVTGGWRKLHNEELHNLYSSPSIFRMIKSRRMRWAGHVARMGRSGNPEGKRPLGRLRRRWVDTIKMDFR
jgi:hypothetical protein